MLKYKGHWIRKYVVLYDRHCFLFYRYYCVTLHIMLFYYIFTECVIPDVLNNRTHVKSTKGRVLLYPEINPPATNV